MVNKYVHVVMCAESALSSTDVSGLVDVGVTCTRAALSSTDVSGLVDVGVTCTRAALSSNAAACFVAGFAWHALSVLSPPLPLVGRVTTASLARLSVANP
jgi:hypothetical protein